MFKKLIFFSKASTDVSVSIYDRDERIQSYANSLFVGVDEYKKKYEALDENLTF
jgi:hypothetical protein